MTHQKAACISAALSPPQVHSPADNSSSPPSVHDHTPPHSEDLHAIFDHFDENKDGQISRDEMIASLQRLGLGVPPSELAELMGNADTNADGFINYEEFVGLYSTLAGSNAGAGVGDDAEEGAADRELREAFDVFDKDGDGLITAKELHTVLKSMGVLQGRSISDCVAMIRKVDSDGNGQVDFDEFKEMMSSGV